jgi:hypothetical protein
METNTIEIPSAAIGALEQGNKIEAIKLVRAAHGLDLKDSKDMVDRYLREHPSLQQRYASVQSENNRTGLMWMLLVIAIVCVIAYMAIGSK